ncbi:hypothetical protein ACK3SF_04155 [Candidatus Nanosalina sp. VS9-1]|uniref:hypothetical protein n=1 Tax=Candidatus Nanosalina sp. VS9-1 TaxID=3388566 RepID=UPI0039E1C23B
MNIEIKPTQDTEQLSENLEERVQSSEVKDGKVVIEIDEENRGLMERTPGIEEYTVDGETFEGLKGRPVQEKAYARLEDKRDVAEALLATMEGYDLVVLDTALDWELKLLRRFNPDIKHLTSGRSEIFDVEKTLEDEDDREKIEYDISDEEVEVLNRFMQPKSLERGEN